MDYLCGSKEHMFLHRCCSDPWLRKVQIVLLVLIVIGVGLIVTKRWWVPKLVEYIISMESEQ